MKVLFVCQANIGRSQVAQVCFDQLSSHESSGAGMAVDEIIANGNLSGNRLKDVPNPRSVEYIKREFGVDVSDRERRQLTPEMLDEADMVIVINNKANWPDYVTEGGKVVFWDIRDGAGQANGSTYQIYAQVRQKVEDLVQEIG
jgi:protein-tyrosine-phosphatase